MQKAHKYLDEPTDLQEYRMENWLGFLCHLGNESIDKTSVWIFRHRERIDDLICGHNRTGVVRDINVESSVHFLIRVIRGRVFYHRDLVAKLGGKANSCLHARVCYEPDDDELVDAMRFEQQIQIGVGKASGHPCSSATMSPG